MSARIASSSQSPPRRTTLAAVRKISLAAAAAASITAKPFASFPERASTVDNVGRDKNGQPKPSVCGKAASAPDTNGMATPPPSESRGGLVVDGPVGKSKSLTSLQPRADDDVFGPGSTPACPTSPSNVTVPARATPSGEVAERIRSDIAQQRVLGYNGYSPRPDRDRNPTAANAQGLFPPNALVFVANLSNQRTEDQLELSCHQIFDIYGPCHIKVKIDRNNHPFALVQFETTQAANDAIRSAQGATIDGRAIRLEVAKAERAVIVSKRRGSVSEAEARGLLEKYGAIECVYPTTAIKGRPSVLPRGIYVKFAFYLDCRDALRAMHSEPSDYILTLATAIESRLRPVDDGSPVLRIIGNPRSTTDLKSIFVGNLLDGTTKEDVKAAFDEFGVIVGVNIVRKLYDDGNSVNTFAFVEFTTPQEATKAAKAEKYMGVNKLRIEPKEYSMRRSYRSIYSPATPTARTPSQYPHYGMRQNYLRAVGYNRDGIRYNNNNMAGDPSHHGAMGMSPYHAGSYNTGPYQTPPRFDQPLFPYSLFSPTPPQQQYHGHFPGATFFSSPYQMHMGTIDEHGEEYGFFGGQ